MSTEQMIPEFFEYIELDEHKKMLARVAALASQLNDQEARRVRRIIPNHAGEQDRLFDEESVRSHAQVEQGAGDTEIEDSGHPKSHRFKHKLDRLDRKIISILQTDGRITNVALSREVGISARECLRRVRALEEGGFIRGYHAKVDPHKLSFNEYAFVFVALSDQSEAALTKFESSCRAWPTVRRCTMLNGEIDFLLECRALDIQALKDFIGIELSATENVQSVMVKLVIRTAKDESGVPDEDSAEAVSWLFGNDRA